MVYIVYIVTIVFVGLECLGGEAAHRAYVADGVRGRAIRLTQGAVDGPRDLAGPLRVGPVGVGDGRHDGECQDGELPGGAKGHQHATHLTEA